MGAREGAILRREMTKTRASMTGRFAAMLRRTRLEAGFRSAYAFYHANGGRRVFPFTYTYYARIERGLALPRPGWLPILFSSLRVMVAPGDNRELSVAFLRDLVGHDAIFDDLVAPWLKPTTPEPPRKKALRRLLGGQMRPLSRQEYGAVVSSPAAFRCYLCLTMSREPLAIERLAKAAKTTVARTLAALKALGSRKLAKRAPDGRWSCPLSDRHASFPHGDIGHDERMNALRRHVDDASREGRDFMSRYVMVRAEEGDMLSVARSLQETLQTAQGCAVEEPGERTGIFFISVRLDELLRF